MGTPQARAQRTPECQEVASKLPARHHVTHSADARSWARNKCTENQKNKKKSVYHIDTTADACQSTSRSGFLKSIAKNKKKSQNRENRKNKNRVQGSAYVFAWALRGLDSAPHKSLASSAFIHATQAALYTAVPWYV